MKIPFFKQKNEYTCGPASLQMVFEYFGKHVSQAQLMKYLKTNKRYGTYHHRLIKTAINNGFYCYVNNESSLHEIQHFLSKDLPVLVHFIEPISKDGHYSVIVGYKWNQLILHDPWNGKNFKLAENVFLNLWHDSQQLYQRWLMVISKEDFQLGKQFLPQSVSSKKRKKKLT